MRSSRIIFYRTSRLVGTEGNIIMVASGKCKCGLTPIDAVNYNHFLLSLCPTQGGAIFDL